MENDFFGAVLAFAAGIGVSGINYLLSVFVLKKYADKYSFTPIFRQFIQVLFLIAIYFLGVYTPWNRYYLLIGGVLGITLSMVYFTSRLLRINKALSQNKEGKEERSDG
ncbi:MAG: hypothetical protein IJZ90_03260 [Clostridia bacterium]|nr:hypothetical protein [Clostridia bacterium]